MDKDISPNARVSGSKPPILPKPKVIPEKPQFVKKYVGSAQSPDKYSNGECDCREDKVTVQPLEDICSSDHSSENTLETLEDSSSTVKNAINVIKAINWDETTFQGNHFCKRKPADDIDIDQGGIATPESENGNLSDSEQSLVSFENSLVICDSSFGPYVGAPPDDNLKGNKALLIAKEFVSTEQAYVKDLQLLVVDLKKHLEEKDYTFCAEYDKVVSTLPQLLEFHKSLLSELEERVSHFTDRPRIADVIKKTFPFLKLYSSYMKDFQAQQNALEDCCNKNPRFSQALSSFENTELCRKLTVKAFMLKPVQRIPQYMLILERYMSHLKSEDLEWEDAKAALSIVQDVLIHANSTIKQSDNLSKLLKLQSRLGNYEIIKPGRSFIKEGELQKLSRKEIQLRYCILLSDCLLYTLYSPSSSYLRIKYELPLTGMKVSANDYTEFDVRTSARSFTLKARDRKECAEWVATLQNAIKANIERQLTFHNLPTLKVSTSNDAFQSGKEAPVWVQDKKATMCQSCASNFTVKFRRHHCRCCGRVVCGECSNNRAPLQYQKFEPKRVCDKCYDYLKNEFEDPSSKMIDRVREELGLSESESTSTFEALKSLFKQFDGPKRIHRIVPQPATGGQMRGHIDIKVGKGWKKKVWLVLVDRVLYYYKAEQDVKEYKTLCVFGYKVDQPGESVDEVDRRVLFQLTHESPITASSQKQSIQSPLIFAAPSEEIAQRWITALNEANILE
ncbi:hypothetical protein GE061_000712 [Apolygus lucorum]|uniref:FYVE, RhoGEF and PH domain-containing protein 4 n=1 Tax=Apolygus lucorum TaxID=248454 RepID=A0A8S9Y702_APOLU|nr:hypothetical protein GE061_000712 [Apolygus lucorum]